MYRKRSMLKGNEPPSKQRMRRRPEIGCFPRKRSSILKLIAASRCCRTPWKQAEPKESGIAWQLMQVKLVQIRWN